MRGRTHLLFGLGTLLAAQAATGLVQPHLIGGVPTGPMLCVGAAMLGALAPDLDAGDSELEHSLGLAGAVASGFLHSLGVKHRGVTHYGITAVTVTVAGWLAGWYLGYSDVGLSFGLGYLSHVALADALTIAGVPLLWPWRKKFHLLPRSLRIRTGGLAEQLIGLVLVCLLVAWLPWLLAAETRIGRPDR